MTLPLLENYAPASVAGGKGANLFQLRNLGMPVPAFVVVPNEVMWALLPSGINTSNLDSLRKAISEIQLPEDYVARIRSHFSPQTLLAVRSSAIDEDGGEFSFAGQFESHLYVSPQELAEHIVLVWLSGFSDRVAAYRKTNGLPDTKGISVVIQEMVFAEKAGVAFGANPTNGRRNECLISAVYGLGEGLVSGELNADTYTISGDKTTEQLAEKTHQIILEPEKKKGTLLTSLPLELKHTAVLHKSDLVFMQEKLRTLAAHFGKPQDIEWAIANNEWYLLQARPITNLHKLPDPDAELIVWDNSNIIESYPGVTTPLTFSFIIKMYEAVYRQMCGIMGVEEKEIEKNKDTFNHMLGLIDGRVYYNLVAWYKALALLPGYDLNAEFMERMMGVKERFELKNRTQRTRGAERLRVLNMVRIMVRNYRQLHQSRIHFQREFNEVMQRFDAIDLSSKAPYELMELYLEFEQTLLKKWKAPLVNDFFAMIFFGVTQKLTEKYHLPKGIHNDLLCGARDIISTEPIRRSLELATLVQQSEACIHWFSQHEPEWVWKNRHDFPEVAKSLEEYINIFGERCVGELKLETITYKQQPHEFVRIIQAYVQQGITTKDKKDLDLQMRADAEVAVKKALKGKPLKNAVFHFFLKRARILVSARENLRFERTRGFGKVRQIFCALGDRFYAEGILETPRDIFYLTKEEIFDYIRGTAVTPNLKSLVQLRQAEYAEFEKRTPSERIRTNGAVYHANSFVQEKEAPILKGDLQGLGCCPGRITARVRVVHHPSEVSHLQGDILVTSSTDPGWVTLFPTASAILVERGSLLSHSAIVSREMGKPCIVGITGLLQQLRTGDLVEMDGASGQVKIVERASLNPES
jgi:pyruvate,water dikinase